METDTITTRIETLGEAKVLSPLGKDTKGSYMERFVQDQDRVLIDVDLEKIKNAIKNGIEPPSFEKAGPREKIYFDPSKLKCAIVTCGGLCPGLNDIIRSVVLELYHCYGVKNIYGIRHGLQGFIPEYGHEVMELTAASDRKSVV